MSNLEPNSGAPSPARRALGSVRAKYARIRSDELLGHLARGGLTALVIKLSSAGLTFLMFLLIARIMSADDYGRFALGFSLASFMGIVAGVGLPTAILRWWPEYQTKGNLEGARDILRFGTRLILMVAVVVGIVMAAVSEAVSGGGRLFHAAALLIVPLALSDYFASALRALDRIVAALAPKDVAWRFLAVMIAGVYVLAEFRARPDQVLALLALLLALLILWQWAHLRKAVDEVVPSSRPEPGRSVPTFHRPAVLRVALPMWAAAVLINASQHVDIVVIGLFVTPYAAGGYFAAARVASLLGFVLLAMYMISSPLIARYHYDGDRAGLQALLRRMIVMIAIPTVGGFLVIILFGDGIMRLFNPAYAEFHGLLILLAASYALSALGGPTEYVMQMTDNQTPFLRMMMVGYGAGLLVLLVLLPLIGIWGAAIGHLVSSCIRNLWVRHYSIRHIGVDPSVLSLLRPAIRA